MIFNIKFLALVAAALAVNAQSSSANHSTTATSPLPTSTGSLTPCITRCLTTAASENGFSSLTNVSCACTNTKFQQSSLACLKANCTTTDQSTALALQQKECAALNSTSSSSSATSAATSAAKSSGAAMGKVQFHGEMVGAAVALVGAVVGAVLVL